MKKRHGAGLLKTLMTCVESSGYANGQNIERLEPREMMAADLAGNSIALARAMGTLTTRAVSVVDNVSSADQLDYYKFVTTSASRVDLSLAYMTADVNLALYDSSGNQISVSQNSGTKAESLSALLNAGTYYVGVSNNTGKTTSYLLSMSPTKITDSAGNSTTAARTIGALGNTTVSYTDYVTQQDTADYYKFTLNNYNTVTLTLSGLAADADVQLLDGAGQVVAQATGGANANATLQSFLSKGIYYVRVSHVATDTAYKLTVNSVVKTDYAGNTLSAARNLGTLAAGSVSYTDFLSDVDTVDYYVFRVTSARNISLSLAGLSANDDLQLLDAKGNVIASSQNGDTSNESISAIIAAGSYFVKVSRVSGLGNYTLSMTNSVIVDYAGNTLSAAKNIGALTTTASTYQDYVGTFDTADYYKFTLSQESTVSLALTGLSANASLQVLKSNGTSAAISDNSGTADETISTTLAAGTYYIRVYDTVGSTAYTLSASATATATVTPDVITTNGTISLVNLVSLNELQIVGSSDSDTIVVSQGNSVLTVSINSNISTYNISNIGDIAIWGGDGNDSITVDSTVTLDARIYGGAGNNTLIDKTSGSAIIISIGGGSDTLVGNGGDTSFWFDSTDTASTTAADTAAGRVHKVTAFYQPFTTNTGSSQYISLNLTGQNITDPTDSGTTIRLTNRSLWGTGPSMTDVNQGALGDCYYLATIAGLAAENPTQLMQLVVDLGDGTYAVQFKRNGVTSYVRVDGDFAAYGSSLKFNDTGSSGAIWACVMEKAYAYFRYAKNTYSSIEGGWMATVMSDFGITNSTLWVSSSTSATTLYSVISSALAAGHAVTTGTLTSITSGTPLVGNHAYTIIGASKDASGNITFTVRNPWGIDGASNSSNLNDGIITITALQLINNCSAVVWATA